MLFQIYGRFNVFRIQHRQDMFAFEFSIRLDVQGIIPAGADEIVVMPGYVIKDFAVAAFHKILP